MLTDQADGESTAIRFDFGTNFGLVRVDEEPFEGLDPIGLLLGLIGLILVARDRHQPWQ